MFYAQSKQMAKYSNKITWGYWPSKESPFETWKSFITDKIFDDIFQHINQYILIQPISCRASDIKLTDKIEIKAFISLQCLAEVLRNDKQSREEFRITNKGGIENFA